MRLVRILILTATLALSACSHHSGSRTAANEHVDVVVASYEGIQVWFGEGQGRFRASEQGFVKLPGTTGVASGDLDRDGDLDLFVTRYEKHPAQVWFNEGSGRLRDSGQALGHGEWKSRRIAIGSLR